MSSLTILIFLQYLFVQVAYPIQNLPCVLSGRVYLSRKWFLLADCWQQKGHWIKSKHPGLSWALPVFPP